MAQAWHLRVGMRRKGGAPSLEILRDPLVQRVRCTVKAEQSIGMPTANGSMVVVCARERADAGSTPDEIIEKDHSPGLSAAKGRQIDACRNPGALATSKLCCDLTTDPLTSG